ncbi:MAG: VapC toxin family PIN domain ribonuclease [Pseudomonadota bacterium]
MILVDTSIWIDFMRQGSGAPLDYLLAGESVVMHDFVFGEIAMGSPKNRKSLLALLRGLHRIPTASHFEVMTLIENAKLFGLGLSYIDVHLLAASLASADHDPVRLWTRDNKLLAQAERLGVAHTP